MGKIAEDFSNVPSEPQGEDSSIHLDCFELDVLEWLDCRPRTLNCSRRQIQIDLEISNQVIGQLIEKGFIYEGLDIRCTGPGCIYPEGDQLWLALFGVSALRRIGDIS